MSSQRRYQRKTSLTFSFIFSIQYSCKQEQQDVIFIIEGGLWLKAPQGQSRKNCFLLCFVFRHVGGPARYLDDPEDFLFSLANPVHVKPIKLNHLPNKPYGIYTKSSYGPTFGNGHDLYSPSNANITRCSALLRRTYEGPPPGYVTNVFLAGSYNFLANEIETFYLETQK